MRKALTTATAMMLLAIASLAHALTDPTHPLPSQLYACIPFNPSSGAPDRWCNARSEGGLLDRDGAENPCPALTVRVPVDEALPDCKGARRPLSSEARFF